MYFNEDISDRMMFDLVADSYDQSRPAYPDAVFDEIFSRFSTEPKTLEIGSGSGQATADLAHRSLHVDCVEPGQNFVRELRRKFSRNNDIAIYDCDFEEFESPSTYDLIFSGCALHWIPKEVALPKTQRLLSENGWLAGIWHQMRVDSLVSDAIDEVIVPLMPEFTLPHFEDDAWEIFASSAHKLCEQYGFTSYFAELYEEECELALDKFVQLVKSYSDISGWEGRAAEELFEKVHLAIATTAGPHSVKLNYYFPMVLASK